MKLHIYAENFRSFPVLDWSLPDGLTLIDGFNKNTGGSNMAGKTTLFDAWFWARYGWLPRWKGPKGGQADGVLRRKDNQVVGATLVRVTEQFGSSNLLIERHRPNRLRIVENHVERPGMDQKALEALIGSPDKFLVSVLFPQRRQRSFFWMGDADRMELMSAASGLEDIDRAAQEAKTQRDDATDRMDQLQSAIDIYDSQIKDLPDLEKELEKKCVDTELKLLVARSQSFKLEMGLDELRDEAELKSKEEYEPLIDPMIDQIADLQFQIQALQNEYDSQKQKAADQPTIEPIYQERLDQYAREWDDHSNAINKKSLITEQLNELVSLMDQVASGTCSECKQPLPEDTRRLEIARYQSSIQDTEKKLKEVTIHPNVQEMIDGFYKAKEDLENRKAEIQAAPMQAKAMLAEIQARIGQKRAEERELQKDVQSIKDTVNHKWKEQIGNLRHEMEQSIMAVSFLEKTLKTDTEAHERTKAQMESLRKEITQAGCEIVKQRHLLNQALDLIEVFGPKGYRAICFDGMIEKISDRAGQLLSIMTEGLYSTRLDQVGQDSKGNQKLILKPVILKNSSEVPLDDLSGAAEERAALAYDVGVSDVAGEGLPLLLDEVLSGLDAVGKSEAMLLLEEVSKTRPVLVIDHASEFKAMFSQVVKVVYENEESHLEVT